MSLVTGRERGYRPGTMMKRGEMVEMDGGGR